MAGRLRVFSLRLWLIALALAQSRKALADLRATLAVHMWVVCAVMVGSIKGVMIHNFTFYFLLSCAAFNIIQQLILIRNHILRTTM